MAIDASKVKKTKAVAKFKKYKSAKQLKHYVEWKDFVEPWKEWSKKNRLESTWKKIPTRRKGKDFPFVVERKAVGDGNGKTEIEWKLWDKSDKITNIDVELYSVMRAENRYIREGYKKTASKYAYTFFDRKRKFHFTIENLGVDNFFADGDKYIFCESKFTRNEARFRKWKKDKKKVWSVLGRYTANGSRCRQMSWEWIQDRAKKALKRPSGLKGKNPSTKKAMKREIAKMKIAAGKKQGDRYVNIFGAANVPVYPGVYRFLCGEGIESENVLNVEWPFPVIKNEFIKLDEKFDKWCEERENALSE